MITVTMQQWVVLTFIKTYKQQHGYPPTILDIALGCGIYSKDTAWLRLRDLERAGLLVLGGYRRARTVALVDVPVMVAP